MDSFKEKYEKGWAACTLPKGTVKVNVTGLQTQKLNRSSHDQHATWPIMHQTESIDCQCTHNVKSHQSDTPLIQIQASLTQPQVDVQILAELQTPRQPDHRVSPQTVHDQRCCSLLEHLRLKLLRFQLHPPLSMELSGPMRHACTAVTVPVANCLGLTGLLSCADQLINAQAGME